MKDVNCWKCGLWKGCLHPQMKPTGEGRLGCLIVAEAPGEEEDRRGIQLVGRAGQFFRRLLHENGLDLDRDFWKTNAVACRPPGNRKPTVKEIEYCRPRVMEAVQQYRPRVIWLLGKSAIESFYRRWFTIDSVEAWRRHEIPDWELGAVVIPLYHPSYVLRNERDQNLMSVYQRDLRRVCKSLLVKDYRVERPSWLDRCHIVFTMEEVREVLDRAMKQEAVAFDYETSGLKPYGSGRVWTIAVAWEEGAWAFPYEYPQHWSPMQMRKIKRMWRKFLQSGVLKVAHNVKFEEVWSREAEAVRSEVRNWHWDTMLCAHVLDNRNGTKSLDFQAFVNFGIRPYETPAIKRAKRAGGRMDQVPLPELLKYNAMDALITFWLYRLQKEKIRKSPDSLSRAYRLLFDGALALSRAERQGLLVDRERLKKTEEELEDRLRELDGELKNSEEARQFRKAVRRELNLNSARDLQILFFEVLKMSPERLTERGSPSVDETSLKRMRTRFASLLLERRKLLKIRNTYLRHFKETDPAGRIHPFFNLHSVRTYRSSSSEPNFQNVPKRDPEAMKLIRSLLKPSPGRRLLEVDYSGIEVRIAACYTKDKNLIRYVSDPQSDMHRDIATEIWFLKPEEVTKPIRQASKGGFVFAQFYGSWYEHCAETLWWECIEWAPREQAEFLLERLRQNGIRNYRDFVEHVKEVEDRFWNVRFRAYRDWKVRINEEYRRRGYVETLFGFRIRDCMDERQVINSPIQATAFHCLLWSLIRIDRWLREEGKKTRIVGQIHDSIVMDVEPDELEELVEATRRIMTEDIRKEHDWIIVPLEVEYEVSKIDGNWGEMEELS